MIGAFSAEESNDAPSAPFYVNARKAFRKPGFVLTTVVIPVILDCGLRFCRASSHKDSLAAVYRTLKDSVYVRIFHA